MRIRTVPKVRSHRLKLLLVGALAALIAGGAAAQSTRQGLAKESVVETIKKRGVLNIGLSTFVPWAMRDKKGQLIGFEIDVAKKLAADMGVKTKFVPTSWDGIIPALIAGKFDIIISGMSITSKRNLTVNFTTPYANTGYVVLANAELAKEKGTKVLADLNKTSVTIASRRGSTGAEAMKRHFPKAKKIYFDDDTLSVQELANGKIDAASSTPPKAAFEIERRGDVIFLMSPDQLSPTREAFALRKGDPDALNFFNNWINESNARGWLAERREYWFTGREWASEVGQ
jgi:polar amino acid transport system substrate-binding protein